MAYAPEPTLYGVVTHRRDTPRGCWGFIKPDGTVDTADSIWWCGDAVEGEMPERWDRVAYIRHKYPPHGSRNWSAYRVWRV